MSLEYCLWLKEYTDEHINRVNENIAFIAKEVLKIKKRLDKLESHTKTSNPMPKERS